MPGAIVWGPVPMTTVSPSGVARDALVPPSVPPAPPTFSTTTVWPRRADNCCAMMRPTISVVPPGANGTISVTGLGGQSSAKATRPASPLITDRPMRTATIWNTPRRPRVILFMVFLSFGLMRRGFFQGVLHVREGLELNRPRLAADLL